MDEITYEELRRIQTLEKDPTLSKIDKDFYKKVAEKLKSYKERSDESEEREWRNFVRILKFIHSRRIEKIIEAAFNSLKGAEKPNELTFEEEKIYNVVLHILMDEEKDFKRILSGEYIKEIEEIETKVNEGKKEAVVEILENVEEFVGLDGKTYGPYKENEIVRVPITELETLLKMKVAKIRE